MSYLAQAELLADIIDEIRPIHHAHWMETEGYRHGLEFNPDYARICGYEQIGQYVLFTLRHDGELVGNCGIYLNQSTHTGKRIATEDTIFILPEHRKGGTSRWFHDEVEKALISLGVSETRISVKMANRAQKLFERWGYEPVAVELVKVYPNV